MTIRKSNPYLSLVNSYLIDSPQPSSISYWWNVGSLLGLCLVIQIASGIFLAMHYSSNIELAFNSVEHIMRDVNAGWLIRYIHANGASFFFICLYLHIGKALYYGSYKSPRVLVWSIGVIIFILTIATAFMGYNHNSSPKSNKYFIYNSSVIKNNTFVCQKVFKRNFSQKNIVSNIKDQDITDPKEIFEEIGISPEVWWEYLNKGIVRENIINEVKNKSGIYIIINKITRNCYIGSASTHNLYSRFNNHLIYLNNNKGSKLIKRSVNKHGLNNFIYAILEYYPFEVNQYNNEELLALETSYISLIIPKYNILTEAGQFFGLKNKEINFSKKLNLIKLSLSDERKDLLKELREVHQNYWKLHKSINMRNIARNRSSSYLTKEGINNISLSNSKLIYLISNSSIKNIYTFKSINQTAHFLCCSTKTIQRALRLGWIYIPDIFLPVLNKNHIDNNNSLIEFINKDNLYLYNYKNRLNNKFKLKSGLSNFKHFTKFIISSSYEDNNI